METFTPYAGLVGGALLGLAASLLLLFHGRIAGISGILGETLRGEGTRGDGAYRGAFLAGLAVAGVGLRIFYPAAFASSLGGGASAVTVGLVALAGVLVGYGTRLGNGCTTGHGICGLSRFSKRSVVATMTFMATGAMTVFVVRHLLGVGR